MKKISNDVKSNLPDYDNRPCFNQIILTDELNLSLEIPPDFVRTYLPEVMPPKAVLKGPSGDCWNITVRKKGKKASMQHGWQQFYQAHSLGDREFLSFMYNGNMCFDVQIFYKNGRESKYVSTTRKHQHFTPEIKQGEMDIIDIEETESQAQFTKNAKRKTTERNNPASCSRQQPASSKPRAKVRKAAEDFTSKFPHFKHCLTKSNTDSPFLLRIPNYFWAHLPEGRTEFTFYTAKEKSWKVTLIFGEINKIFSKGWRGFAIDNKLKILDICVFELVAPAQMRVHLFPHSD